MRVAILDDYQGVALSLADWGSLDAWVESFRDHVAGDDALVARLAGFDVVVAMRERTPFTRARLERLDALRLTPHVGYVSRGSYEIYYREAVEDIAAWARGEPVRVLDGGDGGTRT